MRRDGLARGPSRGTACDAQGATPRNCVRCAGTGAAPRNCVRCAGTGAAPRNCVRCAGTGAAPRNCVRCAGTGAGPRNCVRCAGAVHIARAKVPLEISCDAQGPCTSHKCPPGLDFRRCHYVCLTLIKGIHGFCDAHGPSTSHDCPWLREARAMRISFVHFGNPKNKSWFRPIPMKPVSNESSRRDLAF